MAGIASRAGIQHASISVSSGTTALVAAVSGKRIRVYSYALVLTSAGTAKFQSASTDKTGAMSFAANGGISCAPGDSPWLSTASGEALNIVTTASAEGHLSYVVEQ